MSIRLKCVGDVRVEGQRSRKQKRERKVYFAGERV
jgi:hypothetical protein